MRRGRGENRLRRTGVRGENAPHGHARNPSPAARRRPQQRRPAARRARRHAQLPPRPGGHRRRADPRIAGPGRRLPLPVLHRHQQRRPHRPPRRRPVGLGEPDLRRRLRRRPRRPPPRLRRAQPPAQPLRRRTPVRLRALPARPRRPAPGHLLLPRQRLRTRTLRHRRSDGPARRRRGRRAGPAGRVRGSPTARPRPALRPPRRAGPRPLLPRHPVETAARALPCRLEWHPGHRLTADELAHRADLAEYRGPHIAALGAAVARDGVLDPAAIGAAVREGRHDPQELKRVWHCLARFGRPVD
ncbi:hypothetical protein KCH_65340 [Kitasatospora cheerisanensis KCTC 2395]|uniref:Uncharacterized protein n=1 Tax=Kitasatospora cheerisanensis KCTC 2395 TaxID=1348663 RepID=A0A066YPB2_9ACTN|nr:hypothetical protein KCH_65340 [Kitasatospora cheerisanensis KCTC 2395]